MSHPFTPEQEARVRQIVHDFTVEQANLQADVFARLAASGRGTDILRQAIDLDRQQQELDGVVTRDLGATYGAPAGTPMHFQPEGTHPIRKGNSMIDGIRNGAALMGLLFVMTVAYPTLWLVGGTDFAFATLFGDENGDDRRFHESGDIR